MTKSSSTKEPGDQLDQGDQGDQGDQADQADHVNHVDHVDQKNQGDQGKQDQRENQKDKANPSDIRIEDVEKAIEILERYEQKIECRQNLCLCASYTVITLIFFTILGLVIERFLPGDSECKII